MKLPAHPVKTGQARQAQQGLPGNGEMITGSAFLPAYPAKAGQGGASSQPASAP